MNVADRHMSFRFAQERYFCATCDTTYLCSSAEVCHLSCSLFSIELSCATYHIASACCTYAREPDPASDEERACVRALARLLHSVRRLFHLSDKARDGLSCSYSMNSFGG